MEFNKIKEKHENYIKLQEEYYEEMYRKYPQMEEYYQEAHQLSVTELFAEIKKMYQKIYDEKTNTDEAVKLGIKLTVFENTAISLIRTYGTKILVEPNLANNDQYTYIDEYPKDTPKRKI